MSALLEGRKARLHIFGATVRASGHPDIHDRLQNSIAELFAMPLAERITGPDARLRAHLFAAQLTGLMIAFSVYDDEYLASVPAHEIVERYGDSLQRFVTG